ncbi:MAG: metal-binding protein [Pyrinomonadaceae bacterium]|nr:metal-binding protein [Pyrinomonadaceae bacterium]MBP6213632.1 metal-binding protein [Pyrinomonadaceae bacterium]
MPSGTTHDAITFLLAFPAAAATYMLTQRPVSSLVVGAAFTFGGLMFGPDLDTVSRQYSRWWIFKKLWIPYRSFFKHRSRFSHGLVFGALFRVIYFLGVATILAYLTAFVWNAIAGDSTPDAADFLAAWQTVGNFVRKYFGENFLLFTFLGLWLGAASHTFTDMAGTFIKTGRREKFF